MKKSKSESERLPPLEKLRNQTMQSVRQKEIDEKRQADVECDAILRRLPTLIEQAITRAEFNCVVYSYTTYKKHWWYTRPQKRGPRWQMVQKLINHLKDEGLSVKLVYKEDHAWVDKSIIAYSDCPEITAEAPEVYKTTNSVRTDIHTWDVIISWA